MYSIREINIYLNIYIFTIVIISKSFAEMFLYHDAFGFFSIFFFSLLVHNGNKYIYVNVTDPITVMLLPLVPKKREKVSAI
jgi:hypothetical protein